MAHPTPRFFTHVYRLVARVPKGRVVTYGQVAAILGAPRAARAVGTALRHLPRPLSKKVPWHRVINASGGISSPGDVRDLARLMLAGCIVGRALYEGQLRLADAIIAGRGP